MIIIIQKVYSQNCLSPFFPSQLSSLPHRRPQTMSATPHGPYTRAHTTIATLPCDTHVRTRIHTNKRIRMNTRTHTNNI